MAAPNKRTGCQDWQPVQIRRIESNYATVKVCSNSSILTELLWASLATDAMGSQAAIALNNINVWRIVPPRSVTSSAILLNASRSHRTITGILAESDSSLLLKSSASGRSIFSLRGIDNWDIENSCFLAHLGRLLLQFTHLSSVMLALRPKRLSKAQRSCNLLG